MVDATDLAAAEASPAAPETAAAAPVETPEPAPVAAPAPIPELDRIGAPKNATFVCLKRARDGEYADALFETLRRQFIIPAAASKASEYRLGDTSLVVFSFPTNPGAIEYDALAAYLAKALQA